MERKREEKLIHFRLLLLLLLLLFDSLVEKVVNELPHYLQTYSVGQRTWSAGYGERENKESERERERDSTKRETENEGGRETKKGKEFLLWKYNLSIRELDSGGLQECCCCMEREEERKREVMGVF